MTLLLYCRSKARYGRQLSVMFWRTLTDIVRNPALLLLHCVVALVMGLITGLTFYDSDMTNIGAGRLPGGCWAADPPHMHALFAVQL